MAWLTALQYAFYAVGTAAAVDSMMTEPPENQTVATGQAAGGAQNPQAQQIFASGQPAPKASAVPNAVQAPMDPNVTANMNALAASTPPPAQISTANTPQALGLSPGAGVLKSEPYNVGQSIIDSAMNRGNLVEDSPGPQVPPPKTDIGGILSNMNNMAGALSAVAPLLGLGPDQQRGIATAGAAGGSGGGQNIFALPQRNTLAQILASLPRTYNG